jgi:hypothetical protein
MSNTDEVFTPAHSAALDAADSAMNKMFDAYVIIGLIEHHDLKVQRVVSSFGGGPTMALGMCEKFRMTQQSRDVINELRYDDEQRGKL